MKIRLWPVVVYAVTIVGLFLLFVYGPLYLQSLLRIAIHLRGEG